MLFGAAFKLLQIVQVSNMKVVTSMKLRFLLPSLVAVLVLIVACTPNPPLRDDTLLIDDTIFTNTECSLPCWRGIIPGQSVWRDVLTQVEDDATLQNMQLEQDEETGAAVIQFQQAGQETICCRGGSETGATLDFLWLRTAPDHTLADFIEVYGEPAYLISSEYSEEETLVNLLYPEISSVVYIVVAGAEGNLGAGNPIIGYLLMEADVMDEILLTNNLYAWDGFGPIQNYVAGEFAITPVPTNDGAEVPVLPTLESILDGALEVTPEATVEE